jgi:hypothetical protein
MGFTVDDLERQVGRAFPGGDYEIAPWRAWLTDDAVVAPRSDEFAHPVFVFIAATGAMGISWDALFAWFGATAADGPMFGQCRLSVAQPLRVGATYAVSGGIVSCIRKNGRRIGVFDLVEYELKLSDRADTLAATCTNSIVFPRRQP